MWNIGNIGNIGYVIFILSLIALTVILSVFGGKDAVEQYGGLILLGAILFWVVSFIFFIINAASAIVALIRGQSAVRPLIGCALPILCIAILGLLIWLPPMR